jgi:hypothetical protein
MLHKKHPRDFFATTKKRHRKHQNNNIGFEYIDFEEIDVYNCDSKVRHHSPKKSHWSKYNQLSYPKMKKYYNFFNGKNYEDFHSYFSSIFKGKYAVDFEIYAVKNAWKNGDEINTIHLQNWGSGIFVVDGKIEVVSPKRKKKSIDDDNIINVSDNLDYQYIDGVWFEVKFSPNLFDVGSWYKNHERNRYNRYKNRFSKFYNYYGFVIESSRTLSKKEVKKLSDENSIKLH